MPSELLSEHEEARPLHPNATWRTSESKDDGEPFLPFEACHASSPHRLWAWHKNWCTAHTHCSTQLIWQTHCAHCEVAFNLKQLHPGLMVPCCSLTRISCCVVHSAKTVCAQIVLFCCNFCFVTWFWNLKVGTFMTQFQNTNVPTVEPFIFGARIGSLPNCAKHHAATFRRAPTMWLD